MSPLGIAFKVPGDPVVRGPARARLLSKVREDSGCWVWTGSVDSKGYARFRDDTGRKVFIHRFVYEMANGPIPEGMTIDHLCRNTSCCNPEHLEVVTVEENIRRGSQGQYQLSKTHCPSGHPYSDENTYVAPSGERQCRTCKREHGRIFDILPALNDGDSYC